MNLKEKIWLFIVVAVLLASAWFFRWEVTSVAGGEGGGRAYMLNRWTGAIYFLRHEDMREVKLEK